MTTTTKDPQAVQFGARLRIARRKVGVSTIAEFSRMTGIRPAQLSRFESGTQMPSTRNLTKIVRALGVSADCLLGTHPIDGIPHSDQAVGNRIRRTREQLGMSVETLAADTGVAPSWVGRLESGMFTASSLVLTKIARVLNTTVEALVAGPDPAQATEQTQSDALVELPHEDGYPRTPRTVALQRAIDDDHESFEMVESTGCWYCPAFSTFDEDGRAGCNLPDGPDTIWETNLESNKRPDDCPLLHRSYLLILD